MAKLKLIPDPSFTATVPIPIPGGEPANVKFTFKHRPKADVLKWLEGIGDTDDAQIVT
jgi:hypothetical protein